MAGASLDQAKPNVPDPPAAPRDCKKPFETGLDTHTAPLGGARVRNLNRYLKSLLNERKKDRKSSAKRAREKDRCRKKKSEWCMSMCVCLNT